MEFDFGRRLETLALAHGHVRRIAFCPTKRAMFGTMLQTPLIIQNDYSKRTFINYFSFESAYDYNLCTIYESMTKIKQYSS